MKLTRLLILAALLSAPLARAEDNGARSSRVLLISVDGLHAQDLARYVHDHPSSTLAQLSQHGVTYGNAHTTTPSDSFPGLLALLTGGTPRSTGVYYDDSYDRTLFPPGSDCSGKPGTEVVYAEIVDNDMSKLFSGGINPAFLPRRKDASNDCVPVYPHQFLAVNTVFEVARAAGLHTAWSDKHPAYELVNGPSNTGVEELYTPEINSLIKNGGTVNGVNLAGTLAQCDGTNSLPVAKVTDYTTCGPAVIAYDDVKVQAVINWIGGHHADGSGSMPVPHVFGMNFQEVSVAQKLPVGGYADAAGTPSALLAAALAHVDGALGRMVAALQSAGLRDQTLVIVTAKHGQSPIDRSTLAMESGGSGDTSVKDPLGFINAADPNVDNVPAPFVNPNDGSSPSTVGHLQTDDVGLLWLQDQSQSNRAAVIAQLTNPANRSAMHAETLPGGTIFSSNIVYGDELEAIYGDAVDGDPLARARAPDVLIQPDHGVIYSGSSKKIAEHGGGTLDDTNVALLVSGAHLGARTVRREVSTTQVAPTILGVLGLDPQDLQAVVKEGTPPLPFLGSPGSSGD